MARKVADMIVGYVERTGPLNWLCERLGSYTKPQSSILTLTLALVSLVLFAEFSMAQSLVNELDAKAGALEILAQQGDPAAYYEFINLVLENRSELVAYRESALNLLHQGAERGDHASQYNLAYLLVNGIWMDQDRAEGERWLRVAVGSGDARTQALLGVVLFKRAWPAFDSPKDPALYDEAIGYLRASTEQGDIYALSFLGIELMLDEATLEEGLEMVKVAAAAGDPRARSALREYENVYGTAPTTEK